MTYLNSIFGRAGFGPKRRKAITSTRGKHRIAMRSHVDTSNLLVLRPVRKPVTRLD